MNIIVHMTPCKPNSTIASARVARFMLETLNKGADHPTDHFTLVDTLQTAEMAVLLNGSVDTLFIVNGPMAFCDFLPALADLVRRSKKVVFVQQDYTIMPPSATGSAETPFRKVFRDLGLRPIFWTTVQKNVQTGWDRYINWNQLTYDPQPLKPLVGPSPAASDPEDEPRFHQEPVLMYYGAYREKREPMFIKYFHNAPYIVSVSTTALRGKKFKMIDPDIQIVEPFTGLGNMPKCSASLYIEDPKSSKEFHSPANRFYELLSAGIPIFFEESTLKMLGQASIVPDPDWVVKRPQELYSKLNSLDLDAMRQQQRDKWHADYVGQLRQRVQDLWAELKAKP